MLTKECFACDVATPNTEKQVDRSQQLSPAHSSEDDFFVFEGEQESGDIEPYMEVMNYLKSGSEMGGLRQIP